MPGHIFASTCGRLDCSSFCFSLLFSHLYRHSRLICLKWLPLSHILHWQISSHWVANTRWILAVTLSRLSSYLSLCICKNCFSYGVFGFSSLLLAFRNDERVFFAFRLVGRSMHCPSSFFFSPPHFSFILFSFSFVLSLLLSSSHSGDIYLLVAIMARAVRLYLACLGQPCLHQFLGPFWKLI